MADKQLAAELLGEVVLPSALEPVSLGPEPESVVRERADGGSWVLCILSPRDRPLPPCWRAAQSLSCVGFVGVCF